MMNLRVMTYNIQHGADHHRAVLGEPEQLNLPQIADVIRAFHPDIVGLNEVRDRGVSAAYREQALLLADALDYDHVYFAKAIDDQGNGPYGNAILSRLPIRSAKTIPIPLPLSEAGCEPRCILHAEFDAPERFDVLITHFGLTPPEQRNAVAAVLELAERRKAPMLMMGDLNLPPEHPILQPLSEVFQDTGSLLPEQTRSFPSERPTIKIDYIFASPEFRAVSAEIPQLVASDHCPCLADLVL